MLYMDQGGVPIDGGESFASATRTVVAQPQPPVATAPSSANTYTGFTDDYRALLSTVNGTTIVLTTNTNGIPSVGDIELVWNSSTGSYRPQILGSVTGTWQSVAIGLVLGDFNVDGFVDVLIKDISSDVFDQIVFANPVEGQSPLAVTAVDEEFQMFFRDVYNWMQDETYFDAANISVELPSYEYHIIYDASLCFANFRISFFSFPVCYSHKMVLASAEYTLNSASINELLPYLSDPDFYTLAGEALQGIFETEYAMQLAPYNSGEFSGCKRYCGAFYGVGYAQRVYDIFVPSTRTTEVFDREHYSLEAYKLVDLIAATWNSPEAEIPETQLLSINSFLSQQFGVADMQVSDDACYTNPVSLGACALAGILYAAVYAVTYVISETIDEIAEDFDEAPVDEGPPCVTVKGRIVPVGTIAHRPLDVLPDTVIQHGIAGSHYNLYEANQNLNNGWCFWKPIGAVAESSLPPGAIPIEPFVNAPI